MASTGGAGGKKIYKVLGVRFELPPCFEIVDALGSGAYGTVVAAKETDDNVESFVAIKKIERAFEHKVFAQRTLRELKIMRLLEHENILSIKSVLQPESLEKLNELYVVTELMETDLTQIIKSNQPLSEQHVQFFTYQILRGLKYLHSAGILHRDLKPRNLLVNSNCDLKICDFGLSRANIPYLLTKSAQMTDYISTRWYRAPEVILSQKQYTGAIDVWSVGCILAELITRKALLPAQNEHEQMQKINDLLGNPDQKLINQIEDRENKEFMLGLPKRKGQDFAKLFSGANPQAIDLIKRMLTYDPDTRITIEEALAHPFLEKLHCETEEPVEKEPVAAFDFDFELYSLRTQEFKELIYEEIQLYHSEEAVDKYMKNRKEHPNGILYQRFGKERMRTMYRTGVAPATEHDK